MVERLNRTQEVSGSTPLSSTVTSMWVYAFVQNGWMQVGNSGM